MEAPEYVPVSGGRLWTVRQGRGPALILCHEGPGLWDYLAPVAGMIDDLVSVYRYDQRASSIVKEHQLRRLRRAISVKTVTCGE